MLNLNLNHIHRYFYHGTDISNFERELFLKLSTVR
jgi:hypothetical protein